MHVIAARNVNSAYRSGMQLLADHGVRSPSRNGPVLKLNEPVTTQYQYPNERVLFDPKRNANPFFHLFEALWMLSGGNDVKMMDQFLPSFKQFSDNGETFHGAYGHRWRHWPVHTTTYGRELDQLVNAIQMLRDNVADRRVVISMWDPERDLNVESKDIPCNDTIKLMVVNGRLNMIVFNRSNDIIYGAYGANAVHLSILQEYIAAMVGVPMGMYWQISTDFHAYLEQPYCFYDFYPTQTVLENPYEPRARYPLRPCKLVEDPGMFDTELRDVVEEIRQHSFEDRRDLDFKNSFFAHVVWPMYRAFRQYRTDADLDGAILTLTEAQKPYPYDIDWLLAGKRWLQQIVNKREKAAALAT